MGNFEKLVVLTVLFLSAIVLAFNLNDSGVEDGTGDPSKDAEDFLAQNENQGDEARGDFGLDLSSGREGGSGNPVDSEAGRNSERPTLLDSGVFTDPVTSLPDAVPRTSPYGPDCIVLAEGLRDVGIPFTLLYDLEDETTWADLTRLLYGDERFVALLQSFNEEMIDAPEVGQIVVPTQDFSSRSGIVAPRRPRTITPQPDVVSAPVRSEPAPERTTSAPSGARYKVQDGDSLSRISDRFFGTKHRWKEIYEANRDVLDSPDWVKPGMTLVIPGATAVDGVH